MPTEMKKMLLAAVDSTLGIHRVVKATLGRSSRLLRQESSALGTRLPSLWTYSNFVATTGGAFPAVIKRERQRDV